MNKLFANSAKFYIGSLSIADFAVFYESWNQSPVKAIHCFYCLRCSRNVSLSLVKLRMYRKILSLAVTFLNWQMELLCWIITRISENLKILALFVFKSIPTLMFIKFWFLCGYSFWSMTRISLTRVCWETWVGRDGV